MKKSIIIAIAAVVCAFVVSVYASENRREAAMSDLYDNLTFTLVYGGTDVATIGGSTFAALYGLLPRDISEDIAAGCDAFVRYIDSKGSTKGTYGGIRFDLAGNGVLWSAFHLLRQQKM